MYGRASFERHGKKTKFIEDRGQDVCECAIIATVLKENNILKKIEFMEEYWCKVMKEYRSE